MAADPSIGRAGYVAGAAPVEAELTRALYEQYANQIFRYCLHQLGSREEAEDAVQSTFLNAFRGIKRGIVPELESAWLFKIAHNVCLSRRRSSWRRGRVESPADFEVVEELAPAPARRADELIGLQDALEEMPENQRRAILLREWQGLSYREIAEELALSQGAVETLLFRARRTLASGLERPPERGRIARAADFGNVVTALKSLVVGGSAAAKVAATVAAVSATTVVAAGPIQHYRAQHHPTPAPRIEQPGKSAAEGVVHVTPAQSGAQARVATPVRAHRHVAKASAAGPPVATDAVATDAVATDAVATAPAATRTVPATAPAAPVELEPVEQAPASATSGTDKGAAKKERQATKAAKHEAKHAEPGPPPSEPPAQQQPSASGANPAGNQKTHGRWARTQRSTTPVVAPAPLALPDAPAPVDQGQQAAAPDSTKANGNGNGNGKDK